MESFAIPIIIIIILSALYGFALILNHMVYRYMLRTRLTLGSLMQLNAIYFGITSDFDKQPYFVHIKCRSKYQFDSCIIEHAFAKYMQDHFSAYKPIYDAYKRDKAEYREYLRFYSELARQLPNISKKSHSSLSGRIFYWLEVKIFEKQKLSAPTFRFRVLRTYTSPKKRNHYAEKATFYPDLFMKICDSIFKREELREKAQKERNALTKEMRYLVMLKAGFACEICGRTQKDGVVLQVDHIKPISKGGKTTMDNLRCLCRDCNIGKLDRFDPNGLNTVCFPLSGNG